MISPESLQVIVYHAPCIDGTAAASVAYQFNKDLQFVPWNLDTATSIFDEFSHKVIGFFDCAPSPEMHQLLESRGNTIQIVDHHVGNQRQCEGKSNCIFDMTRSGCMLAWDYFFPGREIPLLLWHIAKRDLWQFDHPDTRVIGYGAIDNPLIKYQTLPWIECEDMKKLGEQKLQELETRKKALDVRFAKLDDEIIMVADIGSFNFSSELAEYMYMNHPKYSFVCVYFKLHDGRFKLSFRTNKPDIDLSVIAAKYGGGGHAKAAGATVTSLPFEILL